MVNKLKHLHIGLRTAKTTVAVILSMIAVSYLGTTDSKLIFAMLGAMAAVQPTFKASVESCVSQIIGVLFGACMGVLLRLISLPPLVATGIGMVLVITLYNVLGFRFSPSLSCFIVVMVCTAPDIQPMAYAVGRIWDSAIGLGIGMLINTLVFPYDNSRQIRDTVESLDKEVIRFMEEMFDGDEHLPDSEAVSRQLDLMSRQLGIFTDQKLLMGLKRQKAQIEAFSTCKRKAKELLARMEVLSCVERIGRLNEENRRRLIACGANILDQRPLDAVQERDVVTNYHVAKILKLRRELLAALGKE